MYEKLTTKTLVLYEIYFLYESGIFKYYFHTLYEKSTTLTKEGDQICYEKIIHFCNNFFLLQKWMIFVLRKLSVTKEGFPKSSL